MRAEINPEGINQHSGHKENKTNTNIENNYKTPSHDLEVTYTETIDTI